MGGPLAFSQAIHLALCTLHQCNIFTSVPIWAECQLQLGTLLETPLLTSLPELGRHSSVPPHFTPQEWGQLPQWFLSYPAASASVLLPMLYRSGKAGASGPSRHQQKGLSVSVAARGNCFASPRLLIIGTLKQQDLLKMKVQWPKLWQYHLLCVSIEGTLFLLESDNTYQSGYPSSMFGAANIECVL